MDGVGGTAAAPALANTGKSFPPEQLTTMLQHPTVPVQKGGMPPGVPRRRRTEGVGGLRKFDLCSEGQLPAVKTIQIL